MLRNATRGSWSSLVTRQGSGIGKDQEQPSCPVSLEDKIKYIVRLYTFINHYMSALCHIDICDRVIVIMYEVQPIEISGCMSRQYLVSRRYQPRFHRMSSNTINTIPEMDKLALSLPTTNPVQPFRQVCVTEMAVLVSMWIPGSNFDRSAL